MPAGKCTKAQTVEDLTSADQSSGADSHPWEEDLAAAEGLWVLEDLLDDQGIISHLQEILFRGDILGRILG